MLVWGHHPVHPMNTTIGTLLEFKGPQLYTIPPTATVAEAVIEMNQHNIGSMVVMEGPRMLGMFTARDLMRRVIPDGLEVNLHSVFARECVLRELADTRRVGGGWS